MDRERLERQMAFIQEIDKEKQIVRRTYVSDGTRRETDAEHAWHTALMTVLLAEYSNEPIDVLHTVTMLLIHDLVEIDAGDAFAYDAEAQRTQHGRELRAAERIYGLLPEEQGKALRALWEEFEAGETAEARFAHVMDNFQPVMLNAMLEGRLWRENGVTLTQVLKRNEITAAGSEILWDYAYHNFVLPHVESGALGERREGE